MASERLTISEKDRIAKSIIKPLIEQSKKEFEDFGKFADKFFKKNLPKDVIEFMDVNKNNAEYKKDDALNLGKQILNTQESVYTGVGKSQKSLEDAKKIAANNAINFYKQETGGKQQPTNIKYQHKTTQATDTSKGISQTTYSVLAVLIF